MEPRDPNNLFDQDEDLIEGYDDPVDMYDDLVEYEREVDSLSEEDCL